VIAILGDAAGGDRTADDLAAGLGDRGESVVVLAGGWTSGDEAADAIARAEEGRDPLRAVVLASTGVAATERGELAALDPVQWRARVEVPLQRTVAGFQGAHRRLRTSGGSVVVLVPTLALVGASGFAPWAMVAEGQRSLAKAAARAWGHERITVNCVAVPGALLISSMRGGPSMGGDGPGRGGAGVDAAPDRPGQPPRAFGHAPGLAGEVASVVASLVSGSWTGVTGATIAVDGGVWMTP
jgi:NAD(P)-dependent dehydrogenase (short-subunit alcohol dehydrogenase family)